MTREEINLSAGYGARLSPNTTLELKTDNMVFRKNGAITHSFTLGDIYRHAVTREHVNIMKPRINICVNTFIGKFCYPPARIHYIGVTGGIGAIATTTDNTVVLVRLMEEGNSRSLVSTVLDHEGYAIPNSQFVFFKNSSSLYYELKVRVSPSASYFIVTWKQVSFTALSKTTRLFSMCNFNGSCKTPFQLPETTKLQSSFFS